MNNSYLFNDASFRLDLKIVKIILFSLENCSISQNLAEKRPVLKKRPVFKKHSTPELDVSSWSPPPTKPIHRLSSASGAITYNIPVVVDCTGHILDNLINAFIATINRSSLTRKASFTCHAFSIFFCQHWDE